jgi:formylglycine-generating enzyme required for sulfatase activity
MKRVSPIFTMVMVSFCILLANVQAQENSDTTLEIVTDPLGFEMIYVPSGTVQMGIERDVFSEMAITGIFSEYAGGVTGIEIQESYGVFETYEITLQGFWIDKYEVTANQYERISLRCVELDNCSNSNLPQLLTWDDAIRFCAGRGSRLPTESEWEYAASGPDNFIFPWGNELDAELVDNQEYTEFELYEVGSHPLNVSWIGAFDMVGNADEWTDSPFQPYYPWNETSLTNWHEVNPEFLRVVRGGSFEDSLVRKTTYSRRGGFPETAGVRCARISHPNEG